MSTITNVLLTPKTSAMKEHLRAAAAAAVTNTALSITCITLAIGMVGTCIWTIQVAKRIVAEKPLVVRAEKVGRAEAVNLEWDTYKPEDSEMRYFLMQFVTGFYSRNHHIVEDAYPASLHFLRKDLFNAINAQDRKTRWMAQFVNSQDPDISVNILNVVLDRAMEPAYKAQVDAVKTITSPGGVEQKDVHFVVTIWFHSKPELVRKDKELIKYNPLGFLIDSFRADDAFEVTKQ